MIRLITFIISVAAASLIMPSGFRWELATKKRLLLKYRLQMLSFLSKPQMNGVTLLDANFYTLLLECRKRKSLTNFSLNDSEQKTIPKLGWSHWYKMHVLWRQESESIYFFSTYSICYLLSRLFFPLPLSSRHSRVKASGVVNCIPPSGSRLDAILQISNCLIDTNGQVSWIVACNGGK